MPAMLITTSEKLIWRHEETASHLLYRRPSSEFIRKTQASNTSKGITNNQAVVDTLLEWSITGWSGIVDSTGAEVPFEKELIAHLPETYRAAFVEALYAINPEAVQMGN